MNRLGSALTDLTEALGKAAPELEACFKEGCAKLQDAASSGMHLARQPDKLGERLSAASQDLLGAAELVAAGLHSLAEVLARAGRATSASQFLDRSRNQGFLADIERLTAQLGHIERRLKALEAGQAEPPNRKGE